MNRAEQKSAGESHWVRRYGDKHRWTRLSTFPPGIIPPKKVRVYRRGPDFILNWWAPVSKKNQSERVTGDLLAALIRARQIDDLMTTLRTTGVGKAVRIGHADLVSRYLADLTCRADAGEIAPATATRYRSALDHYLAFCEQSAVAKKFPTAATVNREFRLAFDGFLSSRAVTGNGRSGGTTRPMRDPGFVREAVRAIYTWAVDPDRGGILPEMFRNPFLRSSGGRAVLKGDPLGEPDITLPMAIDLMRSCNEFQLRLFGPLLLFGLRAAEPCVLFADHLTDGWLSVPCVPEFGLLTKGRRDKRFPLQDELAPFWHLFRGGKDRGLLLERRAVDDDKDKVPLRGASLAELIAEYRSRCDRAKVKTAADRVRIRDAVLRDAGSLDYDHVQGEFAKPAKELGWPGSATLKDLRHLFATMLNNAGMPEGYRRYLLGHSPGKAAILAYTHLDQLRRHYSAAVRQEWTPLITAVNERVATLRGGVQ